MRLTQTDKVTATLEAMNPVSDTAVGSTASDADAFLAGFQHGRRRGLATSIARPRRTLVGSLAAATLLAVVAIVVAQSQVGPNGHTNTISPLTLAAGQGLLGTSTSNPAQGVIYKFSAAPTLSKATPIALSYRLAIDSDPASEARLVANVFGVAGSPNSDGPSLEIVGNPNATSAAVSNDGAPPEWEYSNDIRSDDINPNGSPMTHAAMDSVVTSDLNQLGVSYQVGDPVYGSLLVDPSCGQSCEETTAQYSVVENGVLVDGQQVNFTFNSSTQVVMATGPMYSVQSTESFPLVSPTGSVARLTRTFNTDSSGVISTVTQSSAPTREFIVLKSATVRLGTFKMTNGATWLLPVYEYMGVARTSQSGNKPLPWSGGGILAISPVYVSSH